MTARQGILKESIDVKEQIWLLVGKYFGLSLNTSWAFLFCIDTYVFTITKVIGLQKKRGICLPNREYICGHRCDRTYMVTNVKRMNSSKNFIVICKKNKYDCQMRNT